MATKTAQYLITGNTFPYRTDLRGLGCTWDKSAKGWRCPDVAAVQAAMPYAFSKGKGGMQVEGYSVPTTAAELVAQYTAPVVAVEVLPPRAVVPRPVPPTSIVTPYTGRGGSVSFGPRDQNTERRTALFEGYSTAREVITAAGLDWTADLTALYLADGREIDQRAVVRSDNQKILGVVSSKYRGPQNVDAMEFFDGVIARGEAQYAGAGMFRGGREVYIQAKLLGASEAIGDSADVCDPYILLRNSHDGTGALQIGFSVTRVLCENTLAAALGEMKGDNRTRRLRHIGDIVEQLDAASHALDGIRREWRQTADTYRKLAAMPMSRSAARDYFEAALAGTSTSERILEESANRVEALYQRGAGAVVGSAWGAYNAITNYLSHERGRDRTRKESLLAGDSAKVNARALMLLAA